MFTSGLWRLLVLLPMSLPAADYYVSTGGRNTASGAETSLWETFNEAVSVIAAGDQVIIRDGVYSEKLLLGGITGTDLAPIEAGDLSYQVPTATDDLGDWNSSTSLEQTNCSGDYWRDVVIRDFTEFFIRLEVSPLTP